MKNVKITAYSVEVYLGLVWAYMGPLPLPVSVFTPFDTLMRKDGHPR
jgi:hypothetical protein